MPASSATRRKRQLAPAPARVRSAQGLRQRHGFLAQRGQMRFETAQRVLPLRFDIAHLGFDPRQRIGHGTRGIGRRARVIRGSLGRPCASASTPASRRGQPHACSGR